MSSILFSLLLLVSLFPLSSSSPSSSLWSSGYVSMALVLESVQENLIPNNGGATLFAPSDAAFVESGQPSLSLLRYHISPRRLSPESLKSLPYGSRIPTLAPNELPLTISTNASFFSINGVRINSTALYHDASLMVYGSNGFFDPSFQIPALSISTAVDSKFICHTKLPPKSFAGATKKLRSTGFSTAATFLELQLVSDSTASVTVFAPSDVAFGDFAGNFSEYAALFRRHVVPCTLDHLPQRAMLPTSTEGFAIHAEISNHGQMLLNGKVPVSHFDLYRDQYLVIHGISDILAEIAVGVQKH